MKILQSFFNLFKQKWAVTYFHGEDTITDLVYADTSSEAVEIVKKKYQNDGWYFYIVGIKKI